MSSSGHRSVQDSLAWLGFWSALDRALMPAHERIRVGIADGGVLAEAEDLFLPGAMPLAIRRRYLGKRAPGPGGALGRGWTLPWDSSLSLDLDGAVFSSAEGLRIYFNDPEGILRAETGTLCPPGVSASLERLGDHWKITRWFPNRYLPGERLRQGDWSLGSPLEVLLFKPVGEARCLRLVEVQDSAGRVLRLLWDKQGELLELRQEEEGRALQLERDPSGRLCGWSGQGPGGLRIRGPRYSYDEAGRLSSVAEAGSEPRRFDYDPQGLLIRIGLKSAAVMSGTSSATAINERELIALAYDPQGRLIHLRVSPQGRELWQEYLGSSAEGPVTRARFEPGGEQLVQCSHEGRPLHRAHLEGGRARWTYDWVGRMVEQQDEEGHLTRYEWNKNGDLGAVVHPEGSRTTFSYDGRHCLVARVHSSGMEVHWRRNPEGGVLTAQSSQFGEVEWKTDGHADVLTVQGDCGWQVSYRWEARRLQLSRQNAGGVGSIRVDGAGLPLQFDQDGIVSARLSWDSAGRWQGLERAHGSVERLERAESGDVIAWKPSSRVHWRLTRAPSGRLLGLVDSLRARYLIEQNGTVKERVLTLPENTTTRGEGGWPDRQVALVLPDGRSVGGRLDSQGRVLELRMPPQEWCRVRWNPPGATGGASIRAILCPRGRQREAEYDEAGRPLRASAPSVKWEGAWTSRSRLRSEAWVLTAGAPGLSGVGGAPGGWASGPVRMETRQDEEGLSRTVSAILPGAVLPVLTETLDSAGRIVLVQEGTKLLQRLSWDSRGRLVSRAGGQLLEQLHYPDSQTLVQRVVRCEGPAQEARSHAGAVLLERTLVWDSCGRLLRVHDPRGWEESFGYDPAGRLIHHTLQLSGRPPIHRQRIYDGLGRLLVCELGTLRWGRGHRLEAFGQLKLEWDEQGMLRCIRQGERTCTFHWDETGRPSGWQGSWGAGAEWRYDPFGRLLLRQSQEGQTWFAWSGDRLLGWRHPSVGSERFWSLGGGVLLQGGQGGWTMSCTDPLGAPSLSLPLESLPLEPAGESPGGQGERPPGAGPVSEYARDTLEESASSMNTRVCDPELRAFVGPLLYPKVSPDPWPRLTRSPTCRGLRWIGEDMRIGAALLRNPPSSSPHDWRGLLGWGDRLPELCLGVSLF